MVLTKIEREHLGKVLGYDTSECTSRTQDGVLKWILKNYEGTEKYILKKFNFQSYYNAFA
ncbi:hypothetical protein SAGO17_0051, partial [Mimivirus AB-566-O17]